MAEPLDISEEIKGLRNAGYNIPALQGSLVDPQFSDQERNELKSEFPTGPVDLSNKIVELNQEKIEAQRVLEDNSFVTKFLRRDPFLNELISVLENDGPIPLNIVLVGRSGIGKSSLLSTVVQNLTNEASFKLPSGMGTTTLCPIKIKFERSAAREFTVEVEPMAPEKIEEMVKNYWEPDIIPLEVTNAFNNISKSIEIPYPRNLDHVDPISPEQAKSKLLEYLGRRRYLGPDKVPYSFTNAGDLSKKLSCVNMCSSEYTGPFPASVEVTIRSPLIKTFDGVSITDTVGLPPGERMGDFYPRLINTCAESNTVILFCFEAKYETDPDLVRLISNLPRNYLQRSAFVALRKNSDDDILQEDREQHDDGSRTMTDAKNTLEAFLRDGYFGEQSFVIPSLTVNSRIRREADSFSVFTSGIFLRLRKSIVLRLRSIGEEKDEEYWNNSNATFFARFGAEKDRVINSITEKVLQSQLKFIQGAQKMKKIIRNRGMIKEFNITDIINAATLVSVNDSIRFTFLDPGLGEPVRWSAQQRKFFVEDFREVVDLVVPSRERFHLHNDLQADNDFWENLGSLAANDPNFVESARQAFFQWFQENPFKFDLFFASLREIFFENQ